MERLGVKYILCIIITSTRDRDYYSPHFSDEDTEAQRIEVTTQGHQLAGCRTRVGSRPGSLAP